MVQSCAGSSQSRGARIETPCSGPAVGFSVVMIGKCENGSHGDGSNWSILVCYVKTETKIVMLEFFDS
jgi:hypothetical protein